MFSSCSFSMDSAIYFYADPKPGKLYRKHTLPVLLNRNYLLQFRFRFRPMISYGSGSGFVPGSVTKDEIDKFHHIYCKMLIKQMLNEGNQIHSFLLCL